MLKNVIKFNRIRNDFEYSSELEKNMFMEEAREFFDAETLAEQIDAVVDMDFVRMGTVIKLAYNGINQSELPYDVAPLDIAIDVVKRELGDNFVVVMGEAERIVDEINLTKIAKLDKDGKVMKQKGLRNATEEIERFLNELLESQKPKED